MSIAPTPPLEPPYYAVIFTSVRTEMDADEYNRMAERMMTLAAKQPGYLGIDTARGEDGLGITVSYWRDEASIAAWKAEAEHQAAQRLGKERWYEAFSLHVARIERAYGKPPTDQRAHQ